MNYTTSPTRSVSDRRRILKQTISDALLLLSCEVKVPTVGSEADVPPTVLMPSVSGSSASASSHDPWLTASSSQVPCLGFSQPNLNLAGLAGFVFGSSLNQPEPSLQRFPMSSHQASLLDSMLSQDLVTTSDALSTSQNKLQEQILLGEARLKMLRDARSQVQLEEARRAALLQSLNAAAPTVPLCPSTIQGNTLIYSPQLQQHPKETNSSTSSYIKAENLGDPTPVLHQLGSTLRSKHDTYVDVSGLKVKQYQQCGGRGGVIQPFPEKLQNMLHEVEQQGQSDIVSFLPHGRAFCVHDPKRFVSEILPKYFTTQTKLVSFYRQLNLYGFRRINSGPDTGAYYHELFLKGRPEFAVYMRRPGVPSGAVDRRKHRDVQALLPDFYSMELPH